MNFLWSMSAFMSSAMSLIPNVVSRGLVLFALVVFAECYLRSEGTLFRAVQRTSLVMSVPLLVSMAWLTFQHPSAVALFTSALMLVWVGFGLFYKPVED